MKNKIAPLTTLLLAFLFLTSCNGQVKTNSPKDNVNESKTTTSGQPKMGSPLLQDKAGNIWSISIKDGVYRYDGKSFTNYTENDGLSSNYVYCILEDQSGNIWFGTADGACYYDGKKFISMPITTITGNISYRKTMPDSYGVPYPVENSVSSILQDRTGIFWFGTMNGIYRYNGITFTHFSHNDGIVNNTGASIGGYGYGVESILEDKDANIWFGGRGTAGLFRFDGKSLTNFKVDGENWVRPLLQDKSGTIWFGSRKHMIYRYDGKNFTELGEKEFADWVFYMDEDKAGNLWFSNGKNGGVTVYDGKSFTNFIMKDGFCYQSPWGICITADRNGEIWFTNRDKSLCLYDGKRFKSFSE